MSQSVLRVIAVALVVLVAPTACGDSKPKSDADTAKQVVEDFNHAISKGDFGAACDLLVESRRKQLEFEQDKGCNAILEQSKQSDPEAIEALGKARVTIVRVVGKLATVEIEGGTTLGPGHQAILEKAEGTWRIAEPAIGVL
jgi:hypothetical protein